MCDLCSASEKERGVAQQNQLSIAGNLRKLADRLCQLASGNIKPHTKEAEAIGLLAKRMIFTLVMEWL